MLDDHNCFMSFDINSEKDAMENLEKFARYVIQPLNPVLRSRWDRIEIMRGKDDYDNKSSSHTGSQQEGASSGSR